MPNTSNHTPAGHLSVSFPYLYSENEQKDPRNYPEGQCPGFRLEYTRRAPASSAEWLITMTASPISNAPYSPVRFTNAVGAGDGNVHGMEYRPYFSIDKNLRSDPYVINNPADPYFDGTDMSWQFFTWVVASAVLGHSASDPGYFKLIVPYGGGERIWGIFPVEVGLFMDQNMQQLWDYMQDQSIPTDCIDAVSPIEQSALRIVLGPDGAVLLSEGGGGGGIRWR